MMNKKYNKSADSGAVECFLDQCFLLYSRIVLWIRYPEMFQNG